jgi:NADH dehydrogenase (ubiquinone) Fe-S protein 4
MRQVVPSTLRFESSSVTLSTPLAPSVKPGTAVHEAKEQQTRHNQPDYTAEVDQASS